MKMNSFLNNIGENKLDGDNEHRMKFQIKNVIKDRNNTFVKSLLLYNKFYK